MYRGEKMSRIAYNQREVDLLARLIRAEAVGEGDEGMLLVGNVVVNRVAAQCDVFRDVTSITEAVYQKNAFAGVESPSLEVLTMKVWKFIR